MDDFGWASVAALITALNSKGYQFSYNDIVDLNTSFDKVRWEFNASATAIRATHGHSYPVLLDEKSETPISTLYHGTAINNINSIIRNGLIPMKRQFVHMSTSLSAALEVGKRHGKPVIINVDGKSMHENKAIFYKTGDDVWLTKQVPNIYLSIKPWHIANVEEIISLKSEIYNELSKTHILYYKIADLELLMRRYDRDDCLFIDNKDGRIYLVHLTWSGKQESNPEFPLTIAYESLTNWINEGLLNDHHEWSDIL